MISLQQLNDVSSQPDVVSNKPGKQPVCTERWRSNALTPLLKQGHLEWVVKDHVQMAFEYLQAVRLHKPFWATCVSVPPLLTVKVFPDVQEEPAVFQCVTIVSHWTPLKKSLTPYTLYPPFRCLSMSLQTP